jgi:hypothetical protein
MLSLRGRDLPEPIAPLSCKYPFNWSAQSVTALRGCGFGAHFLLVAASPRPDSVKSFFGNDGHHDQPRKWAGPVPAQHRVKKQPNQ